jgi:Domain of unknown function (DUF4192)
VDRNIVDVTTTHPRPPALTLRSASDLIEAIPYLLGFHPRDSLVLVGLSQSWKVTITARMDLAESATDEALYEPLDLFVRNQVAAIAIVVFDDAKPPLLDRTARSLSELPASATVERVIAAARARGLTIADAALVSTSRWWSYLCRDAACCPSAGRSLAGPASETAAAATYAGLVAASDRADLVTYLTPDVAARARLSPLVEQAEDEYLRIVLTDKLEPHQRRLKRAIFAAARSTEELSTSIAANEELGRSVATTPAPEEDIARFAVALSDTVVRDAIWMAIDARRLHGRGLWQQMARILPAPYDSAPAFLYGWLAWREGNATLAGMAAERALASNVGYTAAELLLGAVRHGLDPHRTPRLRPRRSGGTEREDPVANPRARGQPRAAEPGGAARSGR